MDSSNEEKKMMANDFYREPVTEKEIGFIKKIMESEMPHVKRLFCNDKVKNMVLAHLRYPLVKPGKPERTYNVKRDFPEPFFVMTFKVDDPEEDDTDPSHDREDHVAYPVPPFEVFLLMVMDKASELLPRRTATGTADEALRYVFFRLWPTVPPGILFRMLFFAGLELFGSHAALSYASVQIVSESLIRCFGQQYTASGATLPIEAGAAYSKHIERIAHELWRANGDDNCQFDARFEVEGSKMPKRKRDSTRWMLPISSTATNRYNLNEDEIRAVIGQPFDIWKERGVYGDDRIESLLGDIDPFREEYKTKLLREKPDLMRDRKPGGLKRCVTATQMPATRRDPHARLILMERKVEQDKTILEKSRRDGVSRMSQAQPTFATPIPTIAAWNGPGPSRTAALQQPSGTVSRQDGDDFLASVPSPLAGTPVGRFKRPSTVRADLDYTEVNANAEVRRLRQELERKDDLLEVCERQKQDLQANSLQLANELGTMREKAAEADHLKADNERLKKESHDALEKLQQKANEADRLKVDNARLTKESQEAAERFQKSHDTAEQLAGDVKNLKVLVEEKARDAEESARKAASKDAEVDSLREQMRLMQDELDAFKSARVQLEARNAEMRRELDQARVQIEIVKRENRYHEDENREQVDQMRTYKREADKLKEDVTRLYELALKVSGSGPQVTSNRDAGMKRSSSGAAARDANAPSPPKRSREDVQNPRSDEDRRSSANAKPYHRPSQTNGTGNEPKENQQAPAVKNGTAGCAPPPLNAENGTNVQPRLPTANCGPRVPGSERRLRFSD